jgi:hypothetical protein
MSNSGPVRVFPLELNEFIELIAFSEKVGKLDQNEIQQLFKSFVLTFEKASCPAECRPQLIENIKAWQQIVLTQRSKK